MRSQDARRNFESGSCEQDAEMAWEGWAACTVQAARVAVAGARGRAAVGGMGLGSQTKVYSLKN